MTTDKQMGQLIDQLGEQVCGVKGAAIALRRTLDYSPEVGLEEAAAKFVVFFHGLEGIGRELQKTYEAMKTLHEEKDRQGK